MNLAIDIGNTAVTVGLFKGQELCLSFSINMLDRKKGALLKKKDFKRYYKDITSCVVCSVVPRMTGVIKKEVKALFGCSFLRLEKIFRY